jgi:thioredoxin 1
MNFHSALSDVAIFFQSVNEPVFTSALVTIMVQQIKNSDELDKLVATTKGKVVVIDYFAMWCGPCVGFTPTYQKMSDEMPEVLFLKVDVDEVPEAADKAAIQSIPAFHVYANGSRTDIVVGASETKLRDAIKKAQSKL